jgi:hypothetical protein
MTYARVCGPCGQVNVTFPLPVTIPAGPLRKVGVIVAQRMMRAVVTWVV